MELKFDSREVKKELKALLKKIEITDETTRRHVVNIIKEATDKLLEESVDRAPIDEGNLVASHERVIEDKGKEVVGHVFIPANSPAAKYAMYMHEKHYSLGVKSLKKQDAVKVKVGRKFMERALFENKDFFENFFVIEIRRRIL